MEDTVTPQLGQRLKARREELGWSLRDLEEHSGVHNSLIFKIEQGRIKDPALSKLRALADAMDLSVTRLLIEDNQLDQPSYRQLLDMLSQHLPGDLRDQLEAHYGTTQAALAAGGAQEP